MHMLFINLATIYQGWHPTLRYTQIQAEQLSRFQHSYTLTWELDPLTTHMVSELRKYNTALPGATYLIPSPHQHTTLPRESTLTKKRARHNSRRDIPHSPPLCRNPQKKVKLETQHNTITARKLASPCAPITTTHP